MRRIPKDVFYFFDGYFLFILLTIFTGISLLTLDDRTVSTSAQSAHKLESVWKHICLTLVYLFETSHFSYCLCWTLTCREH